jgi:hypothetical protein
MAYTPQYTVDDGVNAGTDAFVKTIIIVGSFIGLIVLVGIAVFAVKSWRKYKK